MDIRLAGRTWAVALLGIALLAACNNGDDSAYPDDLPTSSPGAGLTPVRPETPEFQGPWADAMRATFYASDSPFVWAILADGVISQEEVVEAVYRAGECANNSPNMPPGGSIIFNTNVNDRGNMFASFIAPGLSDAPFSSSSAEHSAGERSC